MPEPEPELPPSLVAGDRVEIGGLQGAPQHNGKEGVVTGWVKAKRRYAVEVEGLAKPLAVRVTTHAILPSLVLSGGVFLRDCGCVVTAGEPAAVPWEGPRAGS